jgi:glyoxylase-like metal-dependent hydrolase (beta-lactamase superfamily II)
MTASAPKLPWHPIPTSPSGTTCNVHLLQAGGLLIPYDRVFLPGPKQNNHTLEPGYDPSKSEKYYVPDYCFLIEHPPTGDHYIFDLGMRKDLENLPPLIKKYTLPVFVPSPKSPAEILKKHGRPEQQPEKVKAVLFSHVHFDHVGDGAKAGFTNAELWIGPTTCTYARPGYPDYEGAPVLSENFPTDGSRKIVEAHISDERLGKDGDGRVGKVAQGKKEGKYEAVHLRDVGDDGWIGLGSFDRAFDIFGDGSAYVVDAPGHSPGHQMLLVRVTAASHSDSSASSSDDDSFVLLAGDCYHHPDILKDPERTGRPPYSKYSMHADPEVAIETIHRTQAFAQKGNVWVMAAHDFNVGEALGKGEKEIEGLVLINDWRAKKLKPDAHL